MPRCNLLSVKTGKCCWTVVVGVADLAFKKRMTKKQLRHQLSFYGVPFALGNVISHVHSISF
ncbi:hypothetical protein T01_12168 [Trichinella spiralis]|uniref:Uncharacterized protein n=1 Tax=Trichinella spiralis TaxID=6334 RepID=A0A0V1BM20_TRISP|nr:hypothetical protein T01_12168 [Trichinella spiralis]